MSTVSSPEFPVRAPRDGEVLVTIDCLGDGRDPLFPAVVADFRWNGWAVPWFTRDVAEVIVQWVTATHAEMPDDSWWARWEGDNVVLADPNWEDDPELEPEIVRPDAEGYYGIGGCSWTWSLVE